MSGRSWMKSMRPPAVADGPRRAVLLISFGGPEQADEIRPFLDNVLRGRPIPPERLELVVQHYLDIGGRSPLNDLTRAQAAALEAELAVRGSALPVRVGMRNWKPFIRDELARLAGEGVTEVIGVIMAAHRGEASIDRYQATVAEACRDLGPTAPAVRYVAPWFDHVQFIDALADRVREGLDELPGDKREKARWLFTAHSVPETMPGADLYVADLNRTAELIAARFDGHPWRLVWQSRSGSPRDPWFGPDICVALPEEAKSGAPAFLVVPIGFVADHVEVLFDLDHQAAEVAGALHRTFARAPTVGTHPGFIRALADRVQETL